MPNIIAHPGKGVVQGRYFNSNAHSHDPGLFLVRLIVRMAGTVYQLKAVSRPVNGRAIIDIL